MKKSIIFLFAVLMVTICFAQKTKDVTKFMGIPVDGTKSEMIQKLKSKGFIYDVKNDVLKGEFNGREVEISVVTNNNKVYRICIKDAYGVDEGDIKINFNKLCKQFENSGKYIPDNLKGYQIGEENILYEMSIHNKRYQAAYYQFDTTVFDTTMLAHYAIDKALEVYTLEEISNLTEEQQSELAKKLFIQYFSEIMSKKSVWFMIQEKYGKLYIVIFYDNEYNAAHGEDL